MTPAFPPELLGARYRAALSNYSLVPFDRLSPNHQQLLGALQRDSDFFGILEPQRPGLGFRTADRETAALLADLEHAGDLSPSATGANLEQLMRLVLDGVLEVEWQDAFLSGPEAHRVLFQSPNTLPVDQGGRLSWSALQYAATLEGLDVRALSQRLYAFNTIPASPEWRRTLPSEEAVVRFLQVDPAGALSGAFEEAGFVASAGGGWLSWERPQASGHPGFKLYLSPLPRYLPQVLERLPEILEGTAVDSFKVGSGLHGILRPDKCVIYLSDQKALQPLASRMKEEFQSIPGHGVPFTAFLRDDGLISWGSDPLGSTGWTGWMGAESWRSWVVSRLAAALVQARAAGLRGPSAIQFAVDRVALEGVHPSSWSPAGSFSSHAAH
jgi:hypothetical protein